MSDKTFIGRCFNGNFQEGTADIKLLLQGEDLKALLDIATAAKKAKDSNAELPAGVNEYNGKLQIALRVRTNRDGDKSYCELDTWKPDPNAQKKSVTASASNTQTRQTSAIEEDDLPF